jgi:hypothetical protein
MRIRSRLVLVFLLAVVLGVPGRADVAPKGGEVAPPKPTGSQEAEVVGLIFEADSQQPTVHLEGKRDRRRFAMVIGLAEFTGIAYPLKGVTPPRPLTHDLFLTMFGRLKVALTKVVINDLRDNTYYATVHLTAGGAEVALDARPSDAIALAIRAKAPVFVEDRVFEKAGAVPGPRRPQI